MTVFDKGSFSEQDKLDRKRELNRDWKKGYTEGFNDGWQSSLDRYIPVDKE